MNNTQDIKLVVAGTRTYNNYKELSAALNNLNKRYNIIEVVSGACKGADLLGERWAKEHNIPIKRFPADWNKYGKRAGYIRNKQMVEYADVIKLFWDGTSRGTQITYGLAKITYNKPTFVTYY